MLAATLMADVFMDSPELQRLRAAITREPGNAELRYLLGAELAQRREYPEAVLQMRTALEINPKLHFARLQLGLLHLTMSQPEESLAIWAPLEELDESAALKAFKRGLEALIGRGRGLDDCPDVAPASVDPVGQHSPSLLPLREKVPEGRMRGCLLLALCARR